MNDTAEGRHVRSLERIVPSPCLNLAMPIHGVRAPPEDQQQRALPAAARGSSGGTYVPGPYLRDRELSKQHLLVRDGERVCGRSRCTRRVLSFDAGSATSDRRRSVDGNGSAVEDGLST
jgi:hypothetical protein